MRSKILIIFILFLLISCTKKEDINIKAKIAGYDDLGRKIVLVHPPERIVIMSSGQIPIIFELGAGDTLVGVPDGILRSYPEMIRKYPSLLKKPRVGRFRDPNIEKIISLNPDLVIGYEAMDRPGKYSSIFKKRNLPYACFTSASSIEHGLNQIRRVGILLGKENEAEALAEKIRDEIDNLSRRVKSRIKTRPLVYYWRGSGTWTYGNKAVINELIYLAGGINLASKFSRQQFKLSNEYVISQNPEVIVISYWQEEERKMRLEEIKKQPGFSEVRALKDNRIYLIDGNSIHTPVRFVEAIRNLAGFIHPEISLDNEK